MRPEITFLGKFGPKCQNFQFKLKFGTKNKLKFHGGAHFFSFWLEIPFFSKFGPKNQNSQFKLKFGNSNMQNSMVMFTFFVLDRKYLFWANLVQKFKTVCLKWNLASRLIRICNGDVHFFHFWLEILFLSKFGPNISIFLFKVKCDT